MNGYIKKDYAMNLINGTDMIKITAQFGCTNTQIGILQVVNLITETLCKDCQKTHNMVITTEGIPYVITVLNRTKYHWDYQGDFKLC